MDLSSNNLFGISTYKARDLLLFGKMCNPVVVAIIDGGVDIDHEDLKNNIWSNLNEIPDNGKDDDKNGYIDDIHGWNFLGSSKGSFLYDNSDLVRSLRLELKRNNNNLVVSDLQRKLNEIRDPRKIDFLEKTKIYNALRHVTGSIGKEYPSAYEFKNYKYSTVAEEEMLIFMVKGLKSNPNFQMNFEQEYQVRKNELDYWTNINYDPRAGNKEYSEPFHGNNDVKAFLPKHGTHVAGIIQSVAKANAKLMILRAIPEGESVDKDFASAIYYAVDNGARIINISANKFSSSDKNSVDQAVKYAMLKNVLIIHASGNNGIELKKESVFPNRYYTDGGEANAWIEVGASSFFNDDHIAAKFSNYSKINVDVYAPGVEIRSAWYPEKYSIQSGTSMAAPVVSGLAALIFSYYPKLNAIDVKDIIFRSVVPVIQKVKTKDGSLVNFTQLCASGGIVNAYTALKLANKVYIEKGLNQQN